MGNDGIGMVDRALKARQIAQEDPCSVEVDIDLMSWVYDRDSCIWLSFKGNYSHSSPSEKRVAEIKREQEYEKRLSEISYWSKIRIKVLCRDGYICQLCGSDGSGKLHVHHIIKKDRGGTDHFDNLITVCPKCHKDADGKLYDPEWKGMG